MLINDTDTCTFVKVNNCFFPPFLGKTDFFLNVLASTAVVGLVAAVTVDGKVKKSIKCIYYRSTCTCMFLKISVV